MYVSMCTFCREQRWKMALKGLLFIRHQPRNLTHSHSLKYPPDHLKTRCGQAERNSTFGEARLLIKENFSFRSP